MLDFYNILPSSYKILTFINPIRKAKEFPNLLKPIISFTPFVYKYGNLANLQDKEILNDINKNNFSLCYNNNIVKEYDIIKMEDRRVSV